MRIVLLFLVCSVQIIRTSYGLETRAFDKSSVVINNQNSVTYTAKSDVVSFFAIGDWGGIPIWPHKTLIQMASAKIMKKLAQNLDSHFQIGLGDNFYFNGVKDVNDDRFEDTFEDVFDSTAMKNNPWFFILGNHDHYGNAKAQIEYTAKSKRWITPSFNYSIDVFTTNGAQKLITILMIDTIVMCGNSPFDSSGPPAYANSSEEQAGKDYLNAFEQKLAAVSATTVPYILVAGHFPVWSIGKHGPTTCLVDKLRPLLHKYRVSAYLSGHDHDLQHIKDTYLNQTVDYIVSGAGGYSETSTVNSNKIPAGSNKYFWANQAFLPIFNGGLVLAKATKNAMEFQFYETDGTLMYTTSIKPRV